MLVLKIWFVATGKTLTPILAVVDINRPTAARRAAIH
jgi:hypothetical protein